MLCVATLYNNLWPHSIDGKRLPRTGSLAKIGSIGKMINGVWQECCLFHELTASSVLPFGIALDRMLGSSQLISEGDLQVNTHA